MLRRITTHDVGAMGDLDVPLSPRLNLLCGDNGLGKTFVLDVAWWVLTRTWAGPQAMPRRVDGAQPSIHCAIGSMNGEQARVLHFDFQYQSWRDTKAYREVPRLVLYARADGGFEVWDPYRESGPYKLPLGTHGAGASSRFAFTPRDVWDGLSAEDGVVLSNGLIRDWSVWQFQRPALFALFTRALEILSPGPDELLRPGPPQRVSIEDARDIPTLLLPYGQVPITHASAGMKRILALSYLLVWTFHEHAEAARLRNQAPLSELVLLIDEVESHLHPRWQRLILPAIFRVIEAIRPSLDVQVLASTHAPLVLASVETFFDEERDSLLHFGLREGKVEVETIPWAKQGDAVNWLVSETFGLAQARSKEAERAIEAAEAFMRGDATPPDLDTRDKIHAELTRVLGGHDPFWPRWLVKTGVVK